MSRHLNETVGFTEAHSANGGRCGRGHPLLQGGPGGTLEKFLKNKDLFKLFSRSNL